MPQTHPEFTWKLSFNGTVSAAYLWWKGKVKQTLRKLFYPSSVHELVKCFPQYTGKTLNLAFFPRSLRGQAIT